MSFPINSTSVITAPIKRLHTVLFRTRADGPIKYAGVFVCKKILGSNSWSQHSWGNASDLFTGSAKENRAVADTVVWQATHRTKANRFRKLDVAEVIDHENSRAWYGSGWVPYGGATGLHVHVSGRPLKSGTPACA